MNEQTDKTHWLDLVGDRAEIGRAVLRLSRLAVAQHQASIVDHASANGLAAPAMDRLVIVTHTEVPR